MFEIGKEYNRKNDIHAKYKGQAQGGISTPKDFPFILVFTSTAGEQHGYVDRYHGGVFWYAGEGQIGDMTMDGGNRAILRHSEDGKSIHVFEYVRKAYVRYVGEAVCTRYHEESGPDRNGDFRKIFIFHLDIDSVDAGAGVSDSKIYDDELKINTLTKKSIEELRSIALAKFEKGVPVKRREAFAYYRSEALKTYIRRRAAGMCEGCGVHAPFNTKSGPFLECHHVHRRADGGPDHPKNVIALCPNCHRKAHYSTDSVEFNNVLKNSAQQAEIKM